MNFGVLGECGINPEKLGNCFGKLKNVVNYKNWKKYHNKFVLHFINCKKHLMFSIPT